MFFETQLDDQTWVLLDAESQVAFSKGGNEAAHADPSTAMKRALALSAQVGSALAKQLQPVAHANPGMEIQFEFAIKADPAGNVFIGAKPDDGQFHVRVRWAEKG
jgi:hypothetical protein